jgi:LCP family protein required for cell wall assembly
MARHPSASIAATLSFVLPGLGQLSVGAVVRGLVFVIPAVTVAIAVVAPLAAGPAAALDVLLLPETLTILLVANVALAAYHVVAIVDARRIAIRIDPVDRGTARTSTVVVVLLVSLALLGHGMVEAVALDAHSTLSEVFVPSEGEDGWAIPEPSFAVDDESSLGLSEPGSSAVGVIGSSPTGPAPSKWSALPGASLATVTPASAAAPASVAAPTATPKETRTPRWAKDGRLDLLLIGSDAGPDRWSLRTDTMIVLSIDIEHARAALFGIPRNMVGVPLAPESAGAVKGGRFPGLLNALYVYAMRHPKRFPGGASRGFRAVTGAVQELVGVRLDGAVVVNLAGFVRLVDAIGGLWIDVPTRLVDRNYPLEDGSGHIRLVIRRGCQRLDGRMALAYARSRHQDSDYQRMRRQQRVLVAVARQVDPLKLASKARKLLKIAKDDLWTTIKRKEIGGLAELAARVDTARVKRVTFVPPDYPSHLTTAEIKRIRKVVRSAFDGKWVEASPEPLRDPCP